MWHLFSQLLLLLIAVVAASLLVELWLFGAISLIEAFPKHPFLAGGILLLFCSFLFLCLLGSRMESRRSVYFSSRAVILFLSAAAAVVSVELVWVGLLSVALTGLPASLEDYLLLSGGLVLTSLAAAGVKHAFRWRVRYWIILLTAFVAGALAGLVIQLGVFLS